MTIDEAIARERQQAKEQRSYIGTTWNKEYSKKCELYAEEHEQLAEWLEELKEIKSNGRYVQGNKAGQKIGYRNAIDDFADKAIKIVYEANNRDRNPQPRDMVADIHYKLLEIAEQLKSGRSDE